MVVVVCGGGGVGVVVVCGGGGGGVGLISGSLQYYVVGVLKGVLSKM